MGTPPPTTPLVNKQLKLSETPAVRKVTSTDPYLNSNLETSRASLIQDLGKSIPELPVKFFLDYLLPGLHQGLNVKNTVSRLAKGKGAEIVNGRWKRFRCDPKDSTAREGATFEPLVELGKAISRKCGTGNGKPILNFQTCPDTSPGAKMRDTSSRPDGGFVMGDSKELHWMDITLVAECKKKDNTKNVADDVRKVIWGMHQCMREDPGRRFTFGMTIEDRKMRLWYCSRAEVLVSEAFDWMTEHSTFVHILLSMMYAEPHEVGWDPTIKHVTDDKGVVQCDDSGRPRLDISVMSEDGEIIECRTTKLISDIGANALRGRGTRVWEVRKLENGEECGDPMVLKESWIDDDRRQEGHTLKLLKTLREVDKKLEPEAREFVQNALNTVFLTVICHGNALVNGEPDHTRQLMTRGEGIPLNCKRFLLPPAKKTGVFTVATRRSKASRTGLGDHRTIEEHQGPVVKNLTYHPKLHYRVIFKEVCQPLYALKSLADIFELLAQATLALRIMHERGWVHRDISTGNILVYQHGKKLVAKLADLEYAKKDSDKAVHEIRTGTSDFMAIEVDAMRYMFYIDTDDDTSTEEPALHEIWEPEDTPSDDATPIDSSESETDAEFRYNPLHDLESIWWVATYFVFNKAVVRVGETRVRRTNQQEMDNYTAQYNYAKGLFYNRAERADALSRPRGFRKQIQYLHESVQPAAHILENLRRKLFVRYKKADRNPSAIGRQIASGLYANFSKAFRRAAKELEQDVLLDSLEVPEEESKLIQGTGTQQMDGTGDASDMNVAEQDVHRSDESSNASSTVSTRLLAKKRSKRPYRAALLGSVGPSAAAGPSAGTRSKTKNSKK